MPIGCPRQGVQAADSVNLARTPPSVIAQAGPIQFLFEVPRLSVDIDLNHIGSVDREGMEAERPALEARLQAIFETDDFTVRRLKAPLLVLRQLAYRRPAESTRVGEISRLVIDQLLLLLLFK